MKLTVVGGGSTYTPELVAGFARLRDTPPVEELAPVDPAAERPGLVGELVRRTSTQLAPSGRLATTSRP